MHPPSYFPSYFPFPPLEGISIVSDFLLSMTIKFQLSHASLQGLINEACSRASSFLWMCPGSPSLEGGLRGPAGAMRKGAQHSLQPVPGCFPWNVQPYCSHFPTEAAGTGWAQDPSPAGCVRTRQPWGAPAHGLLILGPLNLSLCIS